MFLVKLDRSDLRLTKAKAQGEGRTVDGQIPALTVCPKLRPAFGQADAEARRRRAVNGIGS